jgi:ribosomal protein L11 methylase PrmA
MEIGCGHGILGIAAIKNGAIHCTFQDYNSDVI